jgi:hypothetical protein
MIASRTVVRGARALRTAPLRANIRHARFESNASSTTSQAAKTGASSGLVGGIAGGALVFAVSDYSLRLNTNLADKFIKAGYGYYHMSG